MLVNIDDIVATQEDLDKLNRWQKDWLLSFNTVDHKCKVLHVGKHNRKHEYFLDGSLLPQTSLEKDLGLYVNEKLDWSDHINRAINKTTSVIGWVNRNVITREPLVMLNIYKSLIRPHIEYCVQIWSPRHGNWKIIMDIEDVQRKFTRMIDGIGLLPYKERLEKLSITTLLERRMRGDLIEVFKIFRGLVDYGGSVIKFSRSGYNIVSTGRGTQKLDFFPNRVAKYWN